MADSRECSGVRTSGTRSGTVAETCNRLSRLVKERGSLSALGLELARKLEPEENRAKHGLMDLFPQHAGESCTAPKEDASKQEILGSEIAQMTIFYGGELFVFDNFRAEKINDLFKLAMQKPKDKAVEIDLPIMRKASLHHFMKNRKDRSVARAPYQVHGRSSVSSTKHDEDLSLKL